MRPGRYVCVGAVLATGCFADTAGDDGAGDGTSSSEAGDGADTGGPASGASGGTSASSGSDDPDTSGADSGLETGGSTGSSTGEPDCAPLDCPTGEYCVAGACQTDPPPGMVEIPAGPFYRGCNDADCDPDESPPDPTLFVSTFAIDRLEVTAGAYQVCVDGGGCTPADNAHAACNGGRPAYVDHPINCVVWSQADAYCTWIGKRLPTEAQWEKAARGSDGRRHPWGDQPADCTLMVKVENGYGCGTGETWPVGSKPGGGSPYGVLNVAGNVHEWVADWYGPFELGVDDPQGPVTGTQRLSRGGSLVTGDNNSIRISNRNPHPPTNTAFSLGFRCATSG